jgi:ribosomal protein L10
LSRHAHQIANNKKLKSELEPLLSGPLAVVAFPAVSPQHLKTVLSILAPSPEFPAPKRKTNPEYHSPEVQGGLQKLMMLGARVEGKVFDQEGTRWVGGIEGGMDGLRAQLVAVLQGVGAGITNALEGASRSLYFTVESRRADMEEKENPKKEE